MHAAGADAPALTVTGLSKTFAGQVVLDRVDMRVSAGEVHALVGQNGSGKSTLIKVLAGYHTPDPGATATVFGQPLQLGSAADAAAKRLRFVHQDLGLVLDLSVTENVMLGRGYPASRFGRIDWKRAHALAAEVAARTGLDVDVRAPVGTLGLAERTCLAVARVLPEQADDSMVLVLDEPTAALPTDDVDRLFTTLRQLRDAGNAIVIVSHHLDEVLGLADTITVLRDGKRVAANPVGELDHDTLVRIIVGSALPTAGAMAPDRPGPGTPALEVSGLSGGSVAAATFSVRHGEVVGVAGLAGSGREAIAPMLTGRVPRAGQISVDGVVVPAHDPSAALRAGVSNVSGERGRYGTFANLNVRQNLTMGFLDPHAKGGRVSRSSEVREATQWIATLGIVTRGTEAPITSLSGGNQQKVLVARALRREPKVLVLDDPTAGIDVGAREQVHTIIEQACTTDLAVLLVSTDSTELARLCDRVLVFNRGRITHELRRGVDLSAESIDRSQLSEVAA
jgi:ribose transport system ATP-binding protein